MPMHNGQIVEWRRKIPIQPHLEAWDNEGSSLPDLAEAVIMELECAEVELDEISLGWEDDLRSVAESHDIEEFDYMLSLMYDWADAELVWVGA